MVEKETWLFRMISEIQRLQDASTALCFKRKFHRHNFDCILNRQAYAQPSFAVGLETGG